MILIFLLLASPAWAEWVPSGPRSNYNAETNQTRKASGGPLRNYHDGNTWQTVNPDFRLEAGQLVSDSGRHTITANLSTNIVEFNWKGHILGLKVSNLYAFRRSTLQRTLLAAPNFTDRSFDGATITINNIYPNVDLEIENTPDDLSHRFIFHQAARDAFETWWQNNGQHNDIYIINTFRLYADQLNLNWRDRVGDFDLSIPRDITGRVEFPYENAVQFLLPDFPVMLDHPDYYADTTLYKRILLIGGHPYLAEGFKWTAVRDWQPGDLVHSGTIGLSTIGAAEDTGVDDYVHTTFDIPETTGVATLDSFYFYGRFGGYAIVGVYDYDATIANCDLISTQDSILFDGNRAYWTHSPCTGDLLANTGYLIGMTTNGGRMRNDIDVTEYRISSSDCVLPSDLTGATSSGYKRYSAYVVYTVPGNGADISHVRRRKHSVEE